MLGNSRVDAFGLTNIGDFITNIQRINPANNGALPSYVYHAYKRIWRSKVCLRRGRPDPCRASLFCCDG